MVAAGQGVFIFFCLQSPDFCVLRERKSKDQLRVCGAHAHPNLFHHTPVRTQQLLPPARARSLWRACWPCRLLQNRTSPHSVHDRLWACTLSCVPNLRVLCFLPIECPEPPGASCFQKADQSPVSMQRAFAVQGLKMEPQPKVTHPRPSKSHPVKPTNCQQQQRPLRIRNYNLKD